MIIVGSASDPTHELSIHGGKIYHSHRGKVATHPGSFFGAASSKLVGENYLFALSGDLDTRRSFFNTPLNFRPRPARTEETLEMWPAYLRLSGMLWGTLSRTEHCKQKLRYDRYTLCARPAKAMV